MKPNLDIVRQAQNTRTAILAFNISYLPMMPAVIEAVVRLASVARLEWRKFAKVNIGTEIHQAYETTLRESGSEDRAQNEVFDRATWLIS